MAATSPQKPANRHILHADLDAFYASVEQLDNTALRGKPVIVGGPPEGRGVVATASYEARKFGVRSAMPMKTAVRLCPQGIRISPRFDRYKELSLQIMGIFHDLTDLVEPLSLDEAYLDITEAVERGALPLAVSLELKENVKEKTGLTLSIGAGVSKAVAKIASDLYKPDGLVVVAPGTEQQFLAPLAVGKLMGIGPKTAELLRQDGIATIGQLAAQSPEWLAARFGKRGLQVKAQALGQDHDPVHTQRVTKSVSAETTFAMDISDPERLYAELSRLAGNVARHLARKDLRGKTVTVKLRLADFTTFTRQTTLHSLTNSERMILDEGWQLLARELLPGRAFRLLGVGVSTFTVDQPLQLRLALTDV